MHTSCLPEIAVLPGAIYLHITHIHTNTSIHIHIHTYNVHACIHTYIHTYIQYTKVHKCICIDKMNHGFYFDCPVVSCFICVTPETGVGTKLFTTDPSLTLPIVLQGY